MAIAGAEGGTGKGLQETRHFLRLADHPPGVLQGILEDAHRFKRAKFSPPQVLRGQSLAMIFDKRSTRTRVSFEVAMKQLGGHTVILNLDDMHISGYESLTDTAQVMSRYVDALMVRASSHELLEDLAAQGSIPVINGLTDLCHPCQVMADLMTIEERLGSVAGKRIAWFGDFNNMSRTFIEAAQAFDFQLDLAVAGALIDMALPDDGRVRHVPDAAEAAAGADVLVTDTWTSMGQPKSKEEMAALEPFQVTEDLLAQAADHAILMHCMPIHRGVEVTEGALTSKHAVIYDEAENRLHAQKAVLAWCLAESGVALPAQ